MSTIIKILSRTDVNNYDLPPKFNAQERKQFFEQYKWTSKITDTLRTPTNKAGFLLQLGYFKAVNRFFRSEIFPIRDVEFVAMKLNVNVDDIDFKKYTFSSIKRHRSIIMNTLGFRIFNGKCRKILAEEAKSLCTKQMKPRLMFMFLVDFLRAKKIQGIRYFSMAEIITNALKHFEKDLVSVLKRSLDPGQKDLLDRMLEISVDQGPNAAKDSKVKRYKITLLKKINQSARPLKIKENVQDLRHLKTLFEKLYPIIALLKLSPEITRYYAELSIKSQVFQLSRREENRYLLLISFVIHQYYKLNDSLVDVLIQASQTALNTTLRNYKERLYEARQSNHRAVLGLSEALKSYMSTFKKVETILSGKEMTAEDKIKQLRRILRNNKRTENNTAMENMNLFDQSPIQPGRDSEYYKVLESNSLKLQNRVSEIIKNIDFDVDTSGSKIMCAIDYFRSNSSSLGANTPLSFLEHKEQQEVFAENGKLRVSLYKILLFEQVAESIKSGALNLKYSYKYRSFDDYLIPLETWGVQRKELTEKSGLSAFSDFNKIQSSLTRILNDQYRVTNDNIQTGKNNFAKFDSQDKLKVKTPKVEKDPAGLVADLFPKNRFIPLYEVLLTINSLTNFTDCLEHWKIKHNREKPDEKLFLAGIIGYGCNLGIGKISRISTNLNQNELENTANWYFTSDNLNDCNDRVLGLTDKLKLSSVFNRKDELTHTSSDGKKFNIGVDSLNASYSYKYFGKGRGLSSYSFIDHRNLLFHSTVITPSEREAAYVIDGLNHNEVIKSDIHSTDTHGYSELVFAVSHLLGISFAPRIKNFKKQKFYSFERKSDLRAMGYKVLSDGKINLKIINENWDGILRFVATIKLKETTASQLFKRLSSYSSQHPLYRALKQFGRIIKSLFLLQYIDDVELRQNIEKQLNKIESAHKFEGAVFYANNQEFQQGTREGQLISDGCKRLIENAIICWNYLYLSKRIYNASSEVEKKEIINTLKNGSVVTWQHINLQGEYDFSDNLKKSYVFKLPELLDLEMP